RRANHGAVRMHRAAARKEALNDRAHPEQGRKAQIYNPAKGKIGFHGGKVAVHRPWVRSYDGHEVALPTWRAAQARAPRSVAGGASLGAADVFAAPTPNALRPSTDEPKQVSADAQREARRQAVNADRSAYRQQGLRPAGGEPWRPFVGGSNDGFFWGGRGGRA